MQVTGNKTGYHAVPSANAVYHFAFWGANAVHRTGFIQQQGTIARHVFAIPAVKAIGFGALLFGLEWSAGAKIGINIAATSLLCLASYHLLVRYSAVGALLNGQRHTRAPRPLPSAAPCTLTARRARPP